MNAEPLDALPLWLFFLISTGISLLALEGGYRFGRWRHVRATEEKDAPVAAIVGSILALLALMLAFTFNLAAARFDARRKIVVEEANAIGTTYLRTRFLPEPERTEIAELLRNYTELRIHGTQSATVAAALDESEKVHEQLWSRAVAAADKAPESITTGLFVRSLNDVIDLHAKRKFVGLQSRMPITIWVALFLLAIMGMASMGYQAGLSATRRSPAMTILALTFAGILFLIVDLDRAHEGFLRVSQQPMIDLQRSMKSGARTATD